MPVLLLVLAALVLAAATRMGMTTHLSATSRSPTSALQYVLQWPMGVVISSEALSKYDRLHSFLLCHRHASKTLH